MHGKKLTDDKVKFINQNKGKLKQNIIAAMIGVSPACVCKFLKPKVRKVVGEEFFDIDNECRAWGINYGVNELNY